MSTDGGVTEAMDALHLLSAIADLYDASDATRRKHAEDELGVGYRKPESYVTSDHTYVNQVTLGDCRKARAALQAALAAQKGEGVREGESEGQIKPCPFCGCEVRITSLRLG